MDKRKKRLSLDNPDLTIHFPDEQDNRDNILRGRIRRDVLFGSVLKEARKKARLQQKDIADELGVSRTTVINWEADRYKPDHDLIPALCSILDITVSDLYGVHDPKSVSFEEYSMIQYYRELSKVGRDFMKNAMKQLRDSEYKAKDDAYRENYRLFGKPATKAAAGSGYAFVDMPMEPVFIRKNAINKKAQTIVQVYGDSMLPVYHDGDYVYVEKTNDAYPGEDVICATADGMIIKQLLSGRRLRSINPELPYGDKSEDDHVNIIGRVVGIVAPEDFATAEETSILNDIFDEEIQEFYKKNGYENGEGI